MKAAGTNRKKLKAKKKKNAIRECRTLQLKWRRRRYKEESLCLLEDTSVVDKTVSSSRLRTASVTMIS